MTTPFDLQSPNFYQHVVTDPGNAGCLPPSPPSVLSWLHCLRGEPDLSRFSFDHAFNRVPPSSHGRDIHLAGSEAPVPLCNPLRDNRTVAPSSSDLKPVKAPPGSARSIF